MNKMKITIHNVQSIEADAVVNESLISIKIKTIKET